MESEASEQKISRYNSAELLNLRLDSLWNNSKDHARNGEYARWKADLDQIWSELASDLKPKGEEEGTYNKFVILLLGLGDLSNPISRGFQAIPKDTILKREKQYSLLLDMQIWLKRLQNKVGKGTAYDQGDDEYMDG